MVKRVGLIVNPIAGMGGRVGLKGTDGADTVQQALALGAVPEATAKTMRALEKLTPLKDELVVVTCAGDMGESAARELGFETEVVYRAGEGGTAGIAGGAADEEAGVGTNPTAEANASAEASTGEDTRAAAKAMAEQGVDLLLFAGGDGTARDVFESVGTGQLALGIPAGVKIHSPVYANTPGQAGELALLFLTDRHSGVGEREVLDIDEEAVRQDVLRTELYGYLNVPLDDVFLQNPKSPSPASEGEAQLGIAEDVVENMEKDTCYIIGPGTTTRAIMQMLDLPFTLLGVDVVRNGELLGQDVAERELLEFAEAHPCRLVLTPTGGQGYLLGRGNQQISGQVIKRIGKDNVIIIATGDKVLALRGKPLLVDTGDGEADELLAGYHRIKTGYQFEAMHRIEAAG